MDVTPLLHLVYDVSLKVRLLREHAKAASCGEEELSDRELLSLEVIEAFAPLKESALGSLLGLKASSLNELVKKLCDKGYVTKGTAESDRRQRPLQLTEDGQRFFAAIKRRSARRYMFLFAGIERLTDPAQLERVLHHIRENANRHVREQVFGHFDDVESEVGRRA